MSYFSDVRYALRALKSSPLFTVSSVLVFALGIGATTAVFSVVNALLIRPLPVHEPDRLVRLWLNDVERGFDHIPISYPEYIEWARADSGFDSLAALWSSGPRVGSRDVGGETTAVAISQVSANFFGVLGVDAIYGRTFGPEDENRTEVPPIVLSYDFFRTGFGEDPTILGSTVPIRYGGSFTSRGEIERFEVVGVLPPSFDLSSGAEAWIPFPRDPDWMDGRGCECDLIGRVSPNVTPIEARATLQAVHEQFVIDHPAEGRRQMSIVVVPLLETIVGEAAPASLALFSIVSLLLAVAIMNLAGLFLIRALSRRREIAVRSALGAARAAIVRQLILESTIVSLAGLAAGWLLASLGIDLLLAFRGHDLPRIDGVQLDPTVVGFSAMVAFTATLLFGLWPAHRASRLDVVESLKGRSVDLASTRAVAKLVVAEVAIAFVLLVASSLLVRSLIATETVERGYRAENRISVGMSLSASKYPTPESRYAFWDRLIDEVAALPEVVAATPIHVQPGTSGATWVAQPHYEGQSEPEALENPWVSFEFVDPSYFAVMGIDIVRGRGISASDRPDNGPVVVVSQSIADTYWPSEDPIGKWIGQQRRARVVGVASDTRYRELRKPWHSVYYSWQQNPFSAEPPRHPVGVPRNLVVQTRVREDAAVAAVRRRVRSLDSDIPLSFVSFTTLLERELAKPRFDAYVSSLFALVGLAVAITGIYSVIASFVVQRMPEIGLRMALGATPTRLRRAIVGRGLKLALIGVLIGSAFAIPSLRFVRALLYGVSATDILSFLGAALALASVGVIGSYFPSRFASGADPVKLLRQE